MYFISRYGIRMKEKSIFLWICTQHPYTCLAAINVYSCFQIQWAKLCVAPPCKHHPKHNTLVSTLSQQMPSAYRAWLPCQAKYNGRNFWMSDHPKNSPKFSLHCCSCTYIQIHTHKYIHSLLYVHVYILTTPCVHSVINICVCRHVEVLQCCNPKSIPQKSHYFSW